MPLCAALWRRSENGQNDDGGEECQNDARGFESVRHTENLLISWIASEVVDKSGLVEGKAQLSLQIKRQMSVAVSVWPECERLTFNGVIKITFW